MSGPLYEVLGAAPGASSEELKRAYRRAVRTAHPDTGGSAAAFQTVQDAWAVLGDPVRRKAYDVRTSSNGATQSRPGPAAGASRPEERVARPAPSSSRPTTTSDEPTSAASAAPDSSEQPRAEATDVEEETAGPRTMPWRTITVGLVLAAAGVSGVGAAAGEWRARAAAARNGEGLLANRRALGCTGGHRVGGSAALGAFRAVRRGVRGLRRGHVVAGSYAVGSELRAEVVAGLIFLER